MKIPKINLEKPEKTVKPEKPETVTNTVDISEATVRKVWAGEIAAAVLIAFVSVIIAFVG